MRQLTKTINPAFRAFTANPKMNIFNQLGKLGKLLQEDVRDYISLNIQLKQLTIENKGILLLCQQAIARVDQLTSLNPSNTEGLIAVIQHEKMTIKAHFTPLQILFKGDIIEGKLKLLSKPDIETDSLIYRPLVLIWKTLLGGKIDNKALPEKMKIEGDIIYYEFPKDQVQLIDALFHKIEDNSVLNLDLIAGRLIIESQVSINWRDINLQELSQIFNLFNRSSSLPK
jgi:hypothetical protein